MPASPVVSVCIVVLDSSRLALQCLSSLEARGGCPPDTEVVVVANGTPEAELGPLANKEEIVLVRSAVNLGFGTANNLAASLARAKSIVFLNDDSRVHPGCIESLLDAVEGRAAHGSVGAVGGRILSDDGRLQEAGSVLWRNGTATHVGEGMEPGSDPYREPRDVDYASANGFIVRREAWEAAGGFDERYFPAYYEDVDLCLELARLGYRVRYEPSAVLSHTGSHATSAPFRRFLLERNRQLLLSKWATELDRFLPEPRRYEGRAFRIALERAVQRSSEAGGVRHELPSTPGVQPSRIYDSDVPDRLAELEAKAEQELRNLRCEYLKWLERRAEEDHQSLRELRRWASGRIDVRAKSWLVRVVAPSSGTTGQRGGLDPGSPKIWS